MGVVPNNSLMRTVDPQDIDGFEINEYKIKRPYGESDEADSLDAPLIRKFHDVRFFITPGQKTKTMPVLRLSINIFAIINKYSISTVQIGIIFE
jgi:hypothetical protein